ncbi:MAG: GNAT family N-acetyltransferase [Atopostipes suicloacalis]|nr:GNAT family N-acetyltransferase [Atopostipes suicloacalis]MDN6731639.1 GNAT family N-acetyltransferase [Atopostipes suicloacalis]
MENYRLYLAKNNKIETNRLKLRPIKMADAEDIYEYSSSASNTYYVYPKHRTLGDTEFSIANYFMVKPLGKYGIELKKENKLIGTIDLRIQARRRSAEIGYILNESYQKLGYGKEAASAILDFAFKELEVQKVVAKCQSKNKASEALMLALGMKKEGELRQYELWKDGQWIDMLQYAILREEYYQPDKP